MHTSLLERFDAELKAAGYNCRSETLRDLIIGWLASRAIHKERGQAVGVLSFVYDHNRHNLSHRLIHLQHQHHTRVVATIHVHLDCSSCLEVVILRGRVEALRRLADHLTAIKSVQQGSLTLLAESAGAGNIIRPDRRKPSSQRPADRRNSSVGGDAVE